MLNKIFTVLIFTFGIIFIWFLMSLIYYLFVFAKAFIQSLSNRIVKKDADK